MKKAITLTTLSLLLLSCGGGGSVPQIQKVNLISLNENSQVTTLAELPLCFFDLPEVPYIPLDLAFGFATSLRSQTLEDPEAGFRIGRQGDAVIIADETGDTATFDLSKQTIVFSDFDAFFQGCKGNRYPNSLATPTAKTKSYRIVNEESSYVKGAPVTIDLKPYPTLSIKERDGMAYLPFCVFNDLMQGHSAGMVTFAYNFKDAYLDPQGLRDLSRGELTTLGSKYFSEAPKKAAISREFASFAYDQTMFGLDYFYGLKKVRGITSFKAFAQEKGLESAMLSGDLEKMQDAYGTLLLKCLEDGHTTPLTPSPLTDYSDFYIKDEWRSENQVKRSREDEAFGKARKEKGVTKPFEIVGDTAFLFFDDFVDLDESVLYGTLDESVIKGSNAALFAYAYQQIQANDKVKNVVVDLVTNNGGDSEGLVYCLGALLGKFFIDSGSALSNSRTHTTFLTDINVDGKIDEKDVPLCKDHNIYMLDSKFAFSCGNLFPVAAKYNSSKVRTLGDRTGGGTCSVKYSCNALGAVSLTSSLTTLLKKSGDAYTHIEDGAEVDIPLSYEKMFDRADIVAMLGGK